MRNKAPSLLAGCSLALLAAVAFAGDQARRSHRLHADLKPTNEVPALSSVASGRFRATLDANNQTLTYELSYKDLEGAVSQAHIHIGQKGVNGNISVFLCGNPPTVPAAEFPQPPACPPSPATVSGVITAANIVGPANQGIAPSLGGVNEFDELVELLRSGVTYVNVHSAKFGPGEIRGQVRIEQRK